MLITCLFDCSQMNKGPILTLILTGVYFAAPPEAVPPYSKSGKYGIYVQPYSDHSSHDELYEFVSFLKPNTIIPIIEQNIHEPIDLFWSHLWKNSVIPNRILDLAKNSSLVSPINDIFSFSPPDGSVVPNEMIAENYQATKCKNLIPDSLTAPNKIVVKVNANLLKSIKNSSNELTDIHLNDNFLNNLSNTKSSSSTSSSIFSECYDKSSKNNAYKDINREKESSYKHIFLKPMNKTENCNLVQFNNENVNDTEMCKDVLRTLVSTENVFMFQLNSKSKDVSTNTDVDSYDTILKQQNNESLQKPNTFQCNYESKLNAMNSCDKGQNKCEYKYENTDKANFKVSIYGVGSLQDTTQKKDDDSHPTFGFTNYNNSCSTIHDNSTVHSVYKSHANDNQNIICKQKQEKCCNNKENVIDYHSVACTQITLHNNESKHILCQQKQKNWQDEIESFRGFRNYDSVGSQNSATENKNVIHKQIQEEGNEKKQNDNDKYESVEWSRKSEANNENASHKQIQEECNENKTNYYDKYESVKSSRKSEANYENVLHEKIQEKSNENKEKYIDKYESVESLQGNEADYENVLHDQIQEKCNENKEKYKLVENSQSRVADCENVLHEQIQVKSNENKEKYIDKFDSVESSQESEEDFENVLHEQTHEKCSFSDYNYHCIERLQNSTTDNKNKNFVCEQKEEIHNNNNDKEKYSSHSEYQLVDKLQNSIVDNKNKNVLYELNKGPFYNNKNHNVSIHSYQKSANLKMQNISYEGNITHDKNRRNFDLCKDKPIDRLQKNRAYNGNKNVIIKEVQTLNNFIKKDVEFCKSQLTDMKKSIKTIRGIQNEVCKSKGGIFVDISESQNEMPMDILKSTADVENCRIKSSSVENLINSSRNTSLQDKQNSLSSLSNKSLQINRDYNQQLFYEDITNGFVDYKSENDKIHNTNHCDNVFEDSSSATSGSCNHSDSLYFNSSDCTNQKMSSVNFFSDSKDSSKRQTGIVSRNKRKMSMELEKNECCNGLKNNVIRFGYKRRKKENLNDVRKLEFWNQLNCKKIFALPYFQQK